MTTPRPDLASLTKAEIGALLLEKGQPAYRADQLYGWLHKRGARTYEEMTNLPASLREMLSKDWPLPVLETAQRQVSSIDGTRKYLFALRDGNTVETVWMAYRHGRTVCVSSQCGCRMGCRFCASTRSGLTRNLTAGEMLSQVYAAAADTGERVSNVVVMGMGEPMDNYDAVVRFIRMLTDGDGLNISERNVTVSTCGLPDGIRRLKEEHLKISLALSLHAPNDRLRRTIMPVAKRYSLREVMEALRDYYAGERRRLTFEYSLIRGVNDTDGCADQLAALCRGLEVLVNLIPVNPVAGTGFVPVTAGEAQAFKKKLEKHGIHVTIRRELGRDIDGACGQLRQRLAGVD